MPVVAATTYANFDLQRVLSGLMMSTYLYELPTTGAISFQDFCVDQSASYSSQLAEATQARANLRAVLKESKRTDGEKDFLRVVKVGLRYMAEIPACLYFIM